MDFGDDFLQPKLSFSTYFVLIDKKSLSVVYFFVLLRCNDEFDNDERVENSQSSDLSVGTILSISAVRTKARYPIPSYVREPKNRNYCTLKVYVTSST
jgi:hypothetical protein